MLQVNVMALNPFVQQKHPLNSFGTVTVFWFCFLNSGTEYSTVCGDK